MNALTNVEQKQIAVSQNTALSAGPMSNAIAALQAGMTIESLRGIMDLQKEWEANEARKAYVADMAEFKLNPPEIYKTKQVAFQGTSYMHATLGDVAKAVVDALARHGFSHSWETRQSDGLITVNCKITHRMGHSESTSMQSAPDVSGKKNSIQAIASAVTYLSRYTLLAACGLATEDLPDDDGQGYDSGYQQQEPVRATYKEQAWYPQDKFDKNLPDWTAMIQSGNKKADRLIAFIESKGALMTDEQKSALNSIST